MANWFMNNPVKTGMMVVFSFMLVIVAAMAAYIVPEGSRGVLLTWGKVSSVQGIEPGLHFKIPIMQDIKIIEVRTRRFEDVMKASTIGKSENAQTGEPETELQMPSTVLLSANWNVPPEAVTQIYSEYGTLKQYEDRILRPRVLKITKGIFAQYSIEHIISKRDVVESEIADALRVALAGSLASMTDINIEEVDYPETIKAAIDRKQVAKLNAEAEAYNLEQKDLEAQRKTKVANAEAESMTRISKAKASAVIREGEAEALAISAKGKQLARYPNIIQLEYAQRWGGKYPDVVAGDSQSFLMQLPNKK